MRCSDWDLTPCSVFCYLKLSWFSLDNNFLDKTTYCCNEFFKTLSWNKESISLLKWEVMSLMCEQDGEIPSGSGLVAVSRGWPLWGCLRSMLKGWRRQPCRKGDGATGRSKELALVRCCTLPAFSSQVRLSHRRGGEKWWMLNWMVINVLALNPSNSTLWAVTACEVSGDLVHHIRLNKILSVCRTGTGHAGKLN